MTRGILVGLLLGYAAGVLTVADPLSACLDLHAESSQLVAAARRGVEECLRAFPPAPKQPLIFLDEEERRPSPGCVGVP